MNNKILSEIQKIASDIANSNNIDTTNTKKNIIKLYDKLTILEFLEQNINIISEKEEFVAIDSNIEEKAEKKEKKISETIGFSIDRESLVDLDKGEEEEKEQSMIIDESLEDLTEQKIVRKEPEEKIIDKKEGPILKAIDEIKNEKHETRKSSLHEELKKNTIQIGLNDRIAFVKRLFGGNQQDFHRVLSQVNTFSNIDEVKEFIDTMVKPEHNWENDDEYAARFMEIIEAKFQ
jgi:hypothetical protein